MENASTTQVKSSSELTSVAWLNGRALPPAKRPSTIWLTAILGLGIAALIFIFWSKLLAGIVLAVSIVVLSIRLALPAIGDSMDSLLAGFGRMVGHGLGIVILTPIFLLGFTAARIWCRLAKRDPLQLQRSDQPTFWIPADVDRRKTRFMRNMFVTENLRWGRQGIVLRWLPLLVAALLIAEIILRAYGLGHPLLYLNDSVVGYLPVPGQSLVRFGNRITTNDYGMRAPNYAPQKPPDTFRILMLGDSTLYGGSYVDQELLYARQLERRLRAHFQPMEVEVLNMGVNGWGPFHKLGFVEKFGSLEADMAIICLPYGDIYRKKYKMGRGGPFHLANSPPSCALAELYFYVKTRVRGLRQKLRLAPAPTFETRPTEQGDLGIEAYRQLVERLQASGCEVFVEVLPSRDAGMSDAVPDRELDDVEKLRHRLEATGAKFNFPAGIFRDTKADDRIYHDECHLDVAGHAKYADYLLHRLLNNSHSLATLLTKRTDGAP